MVKLSFTERLAYNFLKGEPTYNVPEMALEALGDGIETPSLLILAGLGEDEDYFTIHQYYKQMLQELGLVFEKEQTALFLIRAVMHKVLNEGLDAYEACEFLFDYTMDPIVEGRLKEIYPLYIRMFDLSTEEYKDLDALKQETKHRFQEYLKK